jgi:hypothetical protein
VTKVARLSSRPLFDGWLAGLTSSQRVPLCGKADSKRMGLVVCEALLSLLTFEASSHPYVMRSSDDEGGGLLADGQTRCS